MTSPESSTPTPEPQREPDGDSTEQVNPGPPLNVLDQILSALLEAVDASRGDLDSVDIDALASRFPRHREVVYEEWEALCVRSRKAGKIGPYLRVREVGKGGMGTVWEAFDPRLKRPIAIKQLKAPHIFGLSRGSQDGSPIEREAAALASLNHPNVVVVYGLEVIDGTSCLIMELVRGASLDKLVKACRSGAVARAPSPEGISLADVLEIGMHATTATEHPTAAGRESTPPTSFPAGAILRGPYLQDVCRSMAGAAEGLACAHGLGLVHRDIKPGNLIMDRRFRIKIADFGLAKGSGLAQLSVTGQFIGTWQYASPEQASMRHEVKAPSDVWSLGVSLYELVTLTLPFLDERGEDILRAIRTVKPLRPRDVNPRIPADLDRIIMRCLEKDPTLRPTASDLARHLREFADGEYVSLGAVPIHRRVMSLMRRPTRWSTAAMVGVLAVLLVLGAGSWEGRRQHRRALADALQRAQRSVARVEAHHDPVDFRRSLEALRRLRDVDASASAGDVARLLGRLAVQQANMAAAARFLEVAAAVEPLDPEEDLLRARAAFASGDLEEAKRLYAGLSTEAAKGLLPREEALVGAFFDSTEVDLFRGTDPAGRDDEGNVYVERAQAAKGVGGLPPGAMFCQCLPISIPRWLLVVVVPTSSGLRVRSVPPPEGYEDSRVEGMAIGPLREGGKMRFVAACEAGHFVATGDLMQEGGVQWTKIEDPEPGWAVDPDKNLHAGIALYPPGEPGSGLGRFLAAWYRCGRTVSLHEPSVFPRWPARLQGSDVEILETVTWNGGPRVLLGLGPWDHFSIQLLAPSRGGRLVTKSSVCLGSPAAATVLHRPQGDLLLVGMKAQESYISDLFFGRSTPYGWDYGLYLLEEGEESGLLRPVAQARHPRPQAGKLRPWTADILGDRQEEVLCAEVASGNFQKERVLRTRVLAVADSGAGPRFEHKLWLPGEVKGIAKDVAGATILLMEVIDAQHRTRHRWVRVPR